MANRSLQSICGVPIKRPSEFKIERYNVTNIDRLANGDACGDLIAKKRKFYFTYNSITSDDLDKILNVIWETNSIFFPLTYIENGKQKTAMVYSGSIPSTLYRPEGKWVWKDVSFNLIEK